MGWISFPFLSAELFALASNLIQFGSDCPVSPVFGTLIRFFSWLTNRQNLWEWVKTYARCDKKGVSLVCQKNKSNRMCVTFFYFFFRSVRKKSCTSLPPSAATAWLRLQSVFLLFASPSLSPSCSLAASFDVASIQAWLTWFHRSGPCLLCLLYPPVTERKMGPRQSNSASLLCNISNEFLVIKKSTTNWFCL